MSTEVTPESLRAHSQWALRYQDMATARALGKWAAILESEQRPLPTVPGWYPTIVVERGGESCTGALLTDFGEWVTARPVLGRYYHGSGAMPVHIRWAEQDGKTPGQTLHEALYAIWGVVWSNAGSAARDDLERAAAAVLAAHGIPTLTPVGEHPEPGTRGLLPVEVEDGEWSRSDDGAFVCLAGSEASTSILADPRPDGAM